MGESGTKKGWEREGRGKRNKVVVGEQEDRRKNNKVGVKRDVCSEFNFRDYFHGGGGEKTGERTTKYGRREMVGLN